MEGRLTVTIASDAAGSWGCGVWWNSAWFQAEWNEEWVSVSIVAKELIPIVLARAVWGPQWQEFRSSQTFQQRPSTNALASTFYFSYPYTESN